MLVVAGWLFFDAISERSAPPSTTRPSLPAVAVDVSPALTSSPDGSPRPGPTGSLQTSEPTALPQPTVAPTEPALPPRAQAVEFVPVADFWSGRRDVPLDGLLNALRGQSQLDGAELIFPEQDRAALEQALGITIGPGVRSGDLADIERAVRQGATGLLRVGDVSPTVRALSIDGVSLFGNERTDDAGAWPIRASVPEDGPGWDPGAAWSLVAVGDILLDRGVARQVFTLRKGVDFPFDGGTARIERITCCSSFGWPVPTSVRTGNEGAVRQLLQGADLTIGNLESAVVPGARLSSSGLRFHGRPAMLDGIANAGFDFMSLANNHIGDAGEEGIRGAMRELDRRGILHAGAGATPAQARRAAEMTVNRQRVAIVACDAIQRRYWVNAEKAGSMACRDERVVREIQAMREQADVVIVFPHWGREYRAEPRPVQRQLAADWVAAGADLVIGGHSHWAGAIEELDQRLVFYSLGNFVFDQNWQTETQLGVVIELTFQGDRLTQAWLHPTLILDQAQPNLLEPGGPDWQRVIDQMREGSRGLMP